MNVKGRLLVIVWLAVGALVAAMVALTQHAAHARQAALQAQRDAHLLRTLRSATESQLAAGLPLDLLQPAIAREQTAFPDVIAIDIFSAGGTVLLSTDAANRDTAAPEAWRAQLAQEHPWQREATGQRQIGQRFDNDLGQPAGGIVVTFSTLNEAPTLARWTALSRELLGWLAMGALAALSAAAALLIGLRRLLHPYERAAQLLQGAPATAADTGPLAVAALRQYAQWRQAQRRHQQAMDRLRELDDDA